MHRVRPLHKKKKHKKILPEKTLSANLSNKLLFPTPERNKENTYGHKKNSNLIVILHTADINNSSHKAHLKAKGETGKLYYFVLLLLERG